MLPAADPVRTCELCAHMGTALRKNLETAEQAGDDGMLRSLMYTAAQAQLTELIEHQTAMHPVRPMPRVDAFG